MSLIRLHVFSSFVLLMCFLLVACSGGSSSSPFPASLTSSSSRSNSVSSANFGVTFSQSTETPVIGSAVLFTDTSLLGGSEWLWEFGDGSTSNQSSTGHVYVSTGSYLVKLTIKTSAGLSSASRSITVVGHAVDDPRYTIDQSISDQAQSTTLAFNGLAMLTGDLKAQSFFPPGKVADYTGFQYLRDNDPDEMGHNTSFLTRIACNILYVLDAAQIAKLNTLAMSQIVDVQEYAYRRYTLMQAFRYLLEGTGPQAMLNLSAVKATSRNLYVIDGQIAFDRANLYAEIYNSLTPAQWQYLDAMKGKGWNSWPEVTEAQIADKFALLSPGAKTLVMTYAGDIFSWYAGSVEADIYFCPERHGTYYGGFYIKDAPAIGHEGYTINEQLTATAGAALIDSAKGYVTAGQATLVSSLASLQRSNLYLGSSNMLQLRTDVSLLLRQLRTSLSNGDVIKAKVLELSAYYGELDGENNYYYATIFNQLNNDLSDQKKQELLALRHSILSGNYADGTPFDFTTATVHYLYADPINDQSILKPYLDAAKNLF